MAMLITSVAAVRKATVNNEAGWRLFCTDAGIDPENPQEPEHGMGVAIEKYDLARYGMDTEFNDLVTSTRDFIGEPLS